MNKKDSVQTIPPIKVKVSKKEAETLKKAYIKSVASAPVPIFTMNNVLISNLRGNVTCIHGNNCLKWDSELCESCKNNEKLKRKSYYINIKR
jgi:hypothetical protein